MALTMDQLKAAFKKRTDQAGSGSSNFWDMFYPFYKMNFGEVASFRFLPDLDEDNPWGFLMENRYHEFTVNGKKKRVACLEMYGEDCPVCAASRSFYDDGDKTMGKMFWRKIDYLASGLVLSSPFEYKIEPDGNPARLVSFGPKLFEVVEAAMLNGDFDHPPTDLVNGCDFRINKTQQGEYASYTTSAFARKSTPVSDDALEKIKLLDLKAYRYPKVEKEQLQAMVESVLTGKAFDEKAEAAAPAHSAPAVQKEPKPLASAPAAVKAEVAEPEVKADTAPAETTAAAPAASGRAAEILARLKRNSAPA